LPQSETDPNPGQRDLQAISKSDAKFEHDDAAKLHVATALIDRPSHAPLGCAAVPELTTFAYINLNS
jgi:hypothetical protein